MLDINFIKQNSDLVKKAVTEKGINLSIDTLLQVDQDRRDLLVKVENLRRQRNESQARFFSKENEVSEKRDIETGRKIKEQLDQLEIDLKPVLDKFYHLMLQVPNLPSVDSPVGPDSNSNREISKWGEIPKFSFPTKDHLELGKSLGIIDFEAGVRTSGFRGYYLKGEGAILHWALLQYAFEKIIAKGFTPLVPPTLVKEEVLIGSGHFPFGKENVYQLVNPGKLETGEEISNPVYLTGTSEPTLLYYFADKIISENDLPLKVCALTQCYRSEVGDYGKDTRGLFRVHEFTKVEQVVICKNDLAVSEEWFKTMQLISEDILKELGLPYRVVQTSTGDMGAGKYRMNDIETWILGRGQYGETHSNSNLTDWQARRLNLKFKTKNGETFYCYTLNNTVLASPRILIPILEHNQQEDGSVVVPEVLRKFTGFEVIKPKA